jgi:hypothetical protein
VEHQDQGKDKLGRSVTRAAAWTRKIRINRFGKLDPTKELAEKGETGVSCDGILGLFKLERKHGLFYHNINLVGYGSFCGK